MKQMLQRCRINVSHNKIKRTYPYRIFHHYPTLEKGQVNDWLYINNNTCGLTPLSYDRQKRNYTDLLVACGRIAAEGCAAWAGGGPPIGRTRYNQTTNR